MNPDYSQYNFFVLANCTRIASTLRLIFDNWHLQLTTPRPCKLLLKHVLRYFLLLYFSKLVNSSKSLDLISAAINNLCFSICLLLSWWRCKLYIHSFTQKHIVIFLDKGNSQKVMKQIYATVTLNPFHHDKGNLTLQLLLQRTW